MVDTTATPRIAIIGGGPSGLVILLTLHRRGIPATLYERDTGFTSRSHLGGTLDLGWDSGQRALRENGLQEAFNKISRPEGEEFKICDSAGVVHLAREAEEHAPEDYRPEIDRSTLRRFLLDAVPSESVKWDHGLSTVRALGNGEYELTFLNGTKAVCDIVIGADGAHSRVRPLVSPATPLYHDITGAEISVTPEVAASPELKELSDRIGEGSIYAAENTRVIAFKRNGDGRIRAYALHRGPVDWVLPREPAEARKALLKLYEGWAPWMRKLIEHCDESAIYHRALFYLPIGLRWDHVPGVAIVGDAAHLMSPFAGAGANLAMLDGLELALVLAEAINGGKTAEEREAAVAEWEEKMFARGEKVAATSMSNSNTWFDAGAPGTAVEMVKAFANPETRREA